MNIEIKDVDCTLYHKFYKKKNNIIVLLQVAVMELSSSFERRRLGKHQQILTDISQRCREQEVSDLSNQLSAKVSLRKFERLGKEVTFYSTTFMGNKLRQNNVENIDSPGSQIGMVTISSKPNLEKSYKHFPARRIMRQHSKFDFIKHTNNTAFPKLTYHLSKPTGEPTSAAARQQLAETQTINGPIQLNHYVTPRPDLAPLVLPSVEPQLDAPKEHPNRIDTCFSTKCVTLGPRTKTNLTQGSKSGHVTSRGIKGMRVTEFGRDLSSLHLQTADGGHSPPPNTEQEMDGALTV